MYRADKKNVLNGLPLCLILARILGYYDFYDDETFFKKYSEQRRAQKYTPNDVMKAIQAVREGTNRFRAGKQFGIPRSTMFRLVDKYGRIKNNCFSFMAPAHTQMTSSGSFDQQNPDIGHVDSRDHQFVISTSEHSSENHVKQEVRHYMDIPSSSSGSVPLPTLSPEFSNISPEIKHFDQIPTVVKMNQVNEKFPE